MKESEEKLRFNAMIRYPSYYYPARFMCLVVDFALALVLSLVVFFIWNIRPFVAQWSDVIRFTADDFTLHDWSIVVEPEKWGSKVISTVGSGTAQIEFQGNPGNYDLVMAYRSHKSIESKIRILAGTSSMERSFARESKNPVAELFFRDLELKKGDSIIIESSLLQSNKFTVGYVDLIPSNSSAFRPKGVESHHSFNAFYKAIFYDDMNVHLSAIRIPFFYLILCFVVLSVRRFTPGGYLLGLRVVNSSGRPDVFSSFRRILGHILSACFLGLGWVWPLFNAYRQSWADILSESFVVPQELVKPGIFAHSTKTNIFASSLARLGSFTRVPFNYRLVAAIFDFWLLLIGICLYVSFSNSSEWMPLVTPNIRLEIEDLNLIRLRNEPSLWSSGSEVRMKSNELKSSARTKFQGPTGIYDVALSARGAAGLIRLSVGENTVRTYRFNNYVHLLAPLMQGIEVKHGEEVHLKVLSSGINMDYLEFKPAAGKGYYSWVTGRHYLYFFEQLGLRYNMGGVFLSACFCWLIFYTICLRVLGTTPGGVLLGIRLKERPTSMLLPLRRLLVFALVPLFLVLKCFRRLDIENFQNDHLLLQFEFIRD